MTRENNSRIVNKIVDEMIIEIELLFADRNTLAANIKLIKEITQVLKELDRLYEDTVGDNMVKEAEARDEFLDSIFEQTVIEKTKK